MKSMILLLVLFISANLFPQFAEGDGTSGNPYQVATASQLNDVRNYLSAHFIQTAEIDLNVSPYNTGSGWTPITTFAGNYNGNGYTISGLMINRGDYTGLFGQTDGAALSNITIQDGNIISSGNRSGGLVGQANNNTTITGCSFTGTATGNSAIGGLIGWLESSHLYNSFATGTITINTVGGVLIGNTNSGVTDGVTVSKCYATGTVIKNSNGYAGGLIGEVVRTNVNNCFSTSTVATSNNSNNSGGLFGRVSLSNISNSYSIGAVSSGTGSGGFIGEWYSSSTGNCFWDNQTSGYESLGVGTGNQTGTTGKTTIEMTSSTTFTNATWDFTTIWNIGNGRNNDYPYLQWQYPGDTPLPIELTSFTAAVSDKNVLLNWQTATEVNNSGFEVQRSVVSSQRSDVSGQGSDEWEKVGFIEGSGNSNLPKEYSFTDNNLDLDLDLDLDLKVSYRLKQIDNDGMFEYSEIVTVETIRHRRNASSLPTEYSLYQNYPNPFNPSTVISYQLSAFSNVKLTVYDVLGNEVATLVNEVKEPGVYEVEFNASLLASSVYFYTIKTHGFTATKKLMLMK